MPKSELDLILSDINQCQLCAEHLPLGPRPVVRAAPQARIMIIGQAPGTRVHASGIPWDDPSGDRLRQWLGVDKEQFYDETLFAIMPMGFCYPGKGKSGDLPPRKECAPKWHEALWQQLPNIELTLLIGQYAQQHYLPPAMLKQHKTLTQRVQHWQELIPDQLVLPHPSPRNQLWLKKNDWFEAAVVPWLQQRVKEIMGYSQ